MNTGFLGPAVATALTVYGIETFNSIFNKELYFIYRLQQHLPFTVLKQTLWLVTLRENLSKIVATALTVYGIETQMVLCKP